MPVMDGIEMTMKIREQYDFPIIFLSAKSEDIDKITGLNIGGDDYVTKPFVPMELLARVSSQLRRYHKFLNIFQLLWQFLFHLLQLKYYLDSFLHSFL